MFTKQDKDTPFDVHIDGFDISQFSQHRDNESPDDDASLVDWQPPRPISSTLLPVLPLDPEMIPEPLRPWLIDIAVRMKCPLDFVASASMVMLSSLIGTRLAIKPKTRDDWTITPNLWGL
jgi:hypothetical protein